MKKSKRIAVLAAAACMVLSSSVWAAGGMAAESNMTQPRVSTAADTVRTGTSTKDIVKKSDELAESYNMRGLYYAGQKEYGQAQENFRMAVSTAETKENKEIYLNNVAMTYNRLKQYPKALETIEAVLKQTPNSVSALDTKGDTLISLKRYEEAAGCLTEAILLKPDVGTWYYNRGRAYEGLGQPDKALKDYQQAVSLPGDYRNEATARIKALQVK